MSLCLKWKKGSISSLLYGVEKLWIDRSDFCCQKCVHAEQQALECLTFELLWWKEREDKIENCNPQAAYVANSI